MKQVQISLFALLALLLTLPACTSQDDMPAPAGDELTVQFTACLDGVIDSRTISDGMKVDRLTFIAYDENGNEIAGLRQTDVPVTDGHATLTTRVVKGHRYTFAFWAQNSACTAYSFSEDMHSLNVNYEGMRANDEGRDAFWAVVDDYATTPVTAPFTRDVTLYRPFAQLNFGTTTDDLEDANKVAPITGSRITIRNGVFSNLNLLSGEASQPVVDVEMTTGPLPAEKLAVDGTNYEYLSMNYLLVNTEKSQVNGVKMSAVMNRLNHDTQVDVEVDALPVQRNFRTNVVGRLLTREVEWEVIIDPNFSGEYNYDADADVWTGTDAIEEPVLRNGVYTITKAAQLAWFQDHAPAAGSTIRLSKSLNMSGLSLRPLLGGASGITIDGKSFAIRNFTLTAEGSAGLFDANGLTVKNITIDGATITATADAQGNAWAGVLTGKATGAVTLNDCVVYGSSVTGLCGVGGLVGYATGAVTATKTHVGTTTVTNTEGATAGCVGAFIGLLGDAQHAFTDCEVTNAVVKPYMGAATLACGRFVGCLTGQNDATTVTFTRCATMAYYEGLNELARAHQSTYGDLLGGNQGGKGTVTVH